MDLQVTLGGHRAPWRYRGSRPAREWLESQPWLRGGGCVLLHLGRSGDTDLVLDAIRAEVRAADDAGYAPYVTALTTDENLTDHLKLELCGSSCVADRDLADACAVHPRMFVVLTATSGRDLVRDASTFTDRARKLVPDFRAAFAVVSTSAASDETALDLEIGSPDEHVLRFLDDTQDRLFKAYLHTRIAWESGGSIAVARALDAPMQARTGDDDAVEAALNRFADVQFEQLTSSSKKTLEELLTAISRNVPRSTKRLTNDAKEAHVVWSPFGRDRLRVVPWVARALLRKDRHHPCGQLLRSHLGCAPFGREILGRCLELEARERAKLTWCLGQASPPSDAITRLMAFERGDHESDSVLYPAASPARPVDGWAFTEFGPFIDAAARANAPDLPRRELHGLRHLRNALAHGHYPSWAALKRLLEVEKRLGTRL